MNLINSLLGGRPMKRLSSLFTDKISGERVYLYEDRLGRQWMATGSWSAFRVPSERRTHNESKPDSTITAVATPPSEDRGESAPS